MSLTVKRSRLLPFTTPYMSNEFVAVYRRLSERVDPVGFFDLFKADLIIVFVFAITLYWVNAERYGFRLH